MKKILIALFIIHIGLNAENIYQYESGDLVAIPALQENQQGTYIRFDGKLKKIKGLPFVVENKIVNDQDLLQPIEILFVNFGESRIFIEDESKVFLNESDQKRAAQEARLIQASLKESDTSLSPSFKFIRPVTGAITSPYGKQRYINGQRRSVHLALDMDGATGDPIIAPLKGKVVLTGDFFYTGNTVILDHGGNLFTSYAHMSAIEVKEGEIVQQADLIGRIGETGRVTGPHLHWSVYFEGNRINPEKIIEENYFLSLFQ